MQPEKEKQNKQVYEKPGIRAIELVAEEVLGIGCKTAYSDPKRCRREWLSYRGLLFKQRLVAVLLSFLGR